MLQQGTDEICRAISEPSRSFVAAKDSFEQHQGIRLQGVDDPAHPIEFFSNFPLVIVLSSSRL